jgi:heme/copper-type cytochrome/quinol oxidase subunit 2
MGFIVFFIANMYRFNSEGWVVSITLLVVSIFLLIVGYKKGITKGAVGNKYRTLWQVLFYISILVFLLVLFFFYIHFSSFRIGG